jgi:guanyl-specific ribonuclease Sa
MFKRLPKINYEPGLIRVNKSQQNIPYRFQATEITRPRPFSYLKEGNRFGNLSQLRPAGGPEKILP